MRKHVYTFLYTKKTTKKQKNRTWHWCLPSVPKPVAVQMDFSLESSQFLQGDRLICDLHPGQCCTWLIHSPQYQGAPPAQRDEELSSCFWKAGTYLIGIWKHQAKIQGLIDPASQMLRIGPLVGSTEPWSLTFFTSSCRSFSIVYLETGVM